MFGEKNTVRHTAVPSAIKMIKYMMAGWERCVHGGEGWSQRCNVRQGCSGQGNKLLPSRASRVESSSLKLVHTQTLWITLALSKDRVSKMKNGLCLGWISLKDLHGPAAQWMPY